MDWQNMLIGVQDLMGLQMLWLVTFGVVFGIITGAIPGFSTQLAMIVMFPYSYTLPMLQAAVFLTAIVVGGCFGGSISSILLNVPGAPQNIGATIDGYPMTQKGMASEALGAALGASTFGSLFGGIALILLMKPLGVLALKFGPAEMFLAVIIGITMIASISEGSFLKGIILGCVGMLLGTIGMSQTAAFRGTYGFLELSEGLPLLPMLLGFMGLPEIFSMVNNKGIVNEGISFKPNFRKILYGIKVGFISIVNLIRSSLIGTVIGILPGAGALFATVVSYNEAKRWSKESDSYGKGNIQGVVAAEAANNSSQGGSWAILFALGVPGGASAAILYGALVIKGIPLGPKFLTDHIATGYSLAFTILYGAIILLITGAFICLYFARVIMIPTTILAPILLVFTATGSFAARGYVFDVFLMFIFGIIGYLMKKANYPVMALVLGIILGKMAEQYLVRSLQVYTSFFQLIVRPVFVIMFVFTLVSVLIPVFRLIKQRYSAKKKQIEPLLTESSNKDQK